MITIALVLLAVGGSCFVGRAIAGPSLADRVVAIDGLVVTIVAAILLTSVRSGNTRYLDVGLVVAFIGFVGTAAGARFIERRGG
ncbi:MAG: monovalent cation/H+ antiporter complex subunit F [Acidimicrobiales bacterium]|nr:K+/H+ antiporter subunit F [Actinomycetota bacterium]